MKILQQIKLQYTDVLMNNNKWWSGTLFEDNSTLIEYGRVGDKCSRPFSNKTWNQIEKKAAEKIREGYKEIKLNEIVEEVIDTNLPKHTVNRIQTIFKQANESLSKTSTIDISNLSIEQLKEGKGVLSDFVLNPTEKLLSNYFKCIPTVLPRKIDSTYEVKRILNNLSSEEDRIEQLIAAVESNKVKVSGGNLFDQLGSELIQNTNLQYFQDLINKTSAHGKKYKVEEVWDINCIQEQTKDLTKIGNVKQLYHATQRQNVRHILRSGLIIPNFSNNGRAYGNGVYFADTCSKSLNYTEGYGETYLLIGEAALGNPYNTKSTQSWNDVPTGYNSLFAEAGEQKGAWGGNLRFNEYIIYKTNQQKLKHLLVIKHL